MIPNRGFNFTFKGIGSASMGVLPLSTPTRGHPAAAGKKLTVPGRDGYLWQDDDALDAYQVRIQCYIADNANIDAVMQWLNGYGDLIFSDEPNRAYRARVITAFTRTNYKPRMKNQTFTLTWDVQPCRYLHPAAADLVISTFPRTVNNPGTYKSEPKITITGSGDVVLMIGTQMIEIDGLNGSIVIDSELRECMDTTGTLLMNGMVTLSDDAFPTLSPGANNITKSGSGNIASVRIEPRWRYL